MEVLPMATGKQAIYLDYNASAPLLGEARAAMIGAFDIDANPSSVHAAGRAARSSTDTKFPVSVTRTWASAL